MLLLAVLLIAAADESPESRAASTVAALSKGDFDGAGKHFDETMKKVMPPAKLKETWAAVQKQVGVFKRATDAKTTKIKDAVLVDTICEFEKMSLKLRLSFDKDRRVRGLFFQPTTTPKFDSPPYAKKDRFAETDVVVNEGGDWPLKGVLSLPKGDGPFPAVVLVHGSGPHDRDETIGPNKPFRDLAWGLASAGVAVLRYDRRTYAHGAKYVGKDDITVKEEVVDDVLAAVKLLRGRKEIAPGRVFVVGHSLGGTLAPRIAEQDGKLAGVVMLAANSRPLEDLVAEQYAYLYSLDGGPTKEQKTELAELKTKIARVKKGEAGELPLGLPAAYWKSIREYDQVATAKKLATPMLVMQGVRDYQVTKADFDGWKAGLKGRRNVTFKDYEKLNHLFHAGEGKARPDEYGKAGFVAKEVIDDIAAWVNEGAKP